VVAFCILRKRQKSSSIIENKPMGMPAVRLRLNVASRVKLFCSMKEILALLLTGDASRCPLDLHVFYKDHVRCNRNNAALSPALANLDIGFRG